MVEEININSLKQRIIEVMNGLEVTVEFQETIETLGKEGGILRKEKGIITKINPWISLHIQQGGSGTNIPFAGMRAGIYSIESKDRILYRNEGVLEAYKDKYQRIPRVWGIMHDAFYEKTIGQEEFVNTMPIPAEALELREESTFYLDLK